MNDEKKRLSHYVPSELVEQFNGRADKQDPALQRQVYFERIVRIGMVAEAVLPDMLAALNSARLALLNTDEKDTMLWETIAETALEEISTVLAWSEIDTLEELL